MATPVTDEPIAKSKKPSNSAFKQQRLPAWQPILTAGTVLPTFFVIGLAFIPIGIGLLVSSNDVQECEVFYTDCTKLNDAKNTSCEDILHEAMQNMSKGIPYDDTCTCIKTFHLNEQYKAQVYLYYGLTNYYQNHRRYVKSRDDGQLLGQFPDIDKSKDCIPFETRVVNGTKKKIAPCGAIANSLFNDTFKLEYRNNQTGAYIELNLIKEGIAWPTDKKVKFRNPPGDSSSSWATRFRDTTYPPNWRKPVYELDPNSSNTGYENEDLIVWMRTAALPTFRKLYRKINHDQENFRYLPAGDYRLTVNYNYPVTSFKGTKRIILSNTSWLGGKNPFLGIAYIVVGTICLILAFVFLIIHNKFGRTPNDIVSISQRTPY